MAGHSKWANIQHRKKAQDAKRGKLFTKFIREITVAARMGGEDIDSNPRLRIAVDKALIANMSRDTVDRAIKRGAHGLDSAQVEEIIYEGYGAGGVAVMAMCLTDNRNRTVAEVRHAFTKCGGNLGSSNSVAYLFKKQGVIIFAPGSDEEAIMQHGLDAGAEDIVTHDDGLIEVITTPETFSDVRQKLIDTGLKIENADVTWVAGVEAAVEGETAEKVVKLIDMLEDLDDVQDVYTNAALPDMAT